MSGINLTDGDLTHRQEIVQLLNMAIAQDWKFAFIKQNRKLLSTHNVRLVSVSVQDASFCVESEELEAGLNGGGSLMFRGQSGGLSVMFKSPPVEQPGSTQSSTLHNFVLPYKITCTQLRKTARVQLDEIAEVPATLFLTNGAMYEGICMDISTSGAKFRVDENLKKELRNPQVVDACKISLPDGPVLQTGIQLIDLVAEDEVNVSFLRTQFVHMREKDEQALEAFIDKALENQG